MLYVIKYWAKKRGLSAPAAVPATPSSYAYALMTTAFLQVKLLSLTL